MTGSLSVLNVGAGDIEITFNPYEPSELQRAIAMLKDMQRQGYAILVRNDDGTYSRVIEIDATRGRYIIAGAPTTPSETTDETVESTPPPIPPARKRGRPRREANIATSHAVGVARSAGG